MDDQDVSVLTPSRRRGAEASMVESRKRCNIATLIWEQLVRVKECSDGDDVLVWCQGRKTLAWLALSVKQRGGRIDW